MKEVIAIIRPSQWPKTKAKLMEKGMTAFTAHRVSGRGRQKGLQYVLGSGKVEEGIRTLPKRMVILFLDDEQVEDAVAAIVQANQTGEIGDGKIFVCPLESTARGRAGEHGQDDLS